MFRRGFLLWVYDFIRVVGIASFYVLCVLPDELATMCVNWYNANPLEDSDKPSVSAVVLFRATGRCFYVRHHDALGGGEMSRPRR